MHEWLVEGVGRFDEVAQEWHVANGAGVWLRCAGLGDGTGITEAPDVVEEVGAEARGTVLEGGRHGDRGDARGGVGRGVSCGGR